MPASIHDVARSAGVSVATVSRSFTVPDSVATVTRERVLAAAAALRYEPNRAARGLITGRTGNVGVIVPDLGNPYFHAVLQGAQARARRADYAVFVADGQESAPEEAALINAMRKQVDGIVLCSSRQSAARLAALEDPPAVVLLNRRAAGHASVLLDSAGGMKQAVQHLAELGHRKCVFVSGPRRSWSNQQRKQGLRAAARTYGIEYEILGPVAGAGATPGRGAGAGSGRGAGAGPGAYQYQSGVDRADEILETGATAVLAYNDLVAAGILRRLAELGVGVPERLSVVGFDDIPLATMVSPPLTTVSLPTVRAGEAAVEVLLECLNRPGPLEPAARELPAILVVRGTTAPPPRRGRRPAQAARAGRGR